MIVAVLAVAGFVVMAVVGGFKLWFALRRNDV